MELMFDTCKSWMQSGHPEDLIRAARHYERASQIVISHLVSWKCEETFFSYIVLLSFSYPVFSQVCPIDK